VLKSRPHFVSDLLCLLAATCLLQVSAVPLWMRRAVAAQLDSWERSLLWQHAATPLEVTGAVGLVHLLRAMQEVSAGWGFSAGAGARVTVALFGVLSGGVVGCKGVPVMVPMTVCAVAGDLPASQCDG
jgi:hypothetical protein